jgi:hypothetical protein
MTTFNSNSYSSIGVLHRAMQERIDVLEDALRPFATEFEIADAAGELQHWPPEEVKNCEAAWRVLRK